MFIRLFAPAVLAMALLSACDSSEVASYNKPKEPRADRAVALLALRYLPGQTAPSTDDAARIEGLARQARDSGEPITIAAGGDGSYADQQRLAHVRGLVQRHGASIQSASVSSGVATVPNTIVLQLERYIARDLNCPDWSKSPGYDAKNLPHSNLGCATSMNIQTMVANPRDLEIGREPGLASTGKLTTDAVDRLYRDRTKALSVIGTSALGGGAAAAGSGGSPSP
jgi:type IV pilus biogenesis protein CpaD/CtpE